MANFRNFVDILTQFSAWPISSPLLRRSSQDASVSTRLYHFLLFLPSIYPTSCLRLKSEGRSCFRKLEINHYWRYNFPRVFLGSVWWMAGLWASIPSIFLPTLSTSTLPARAVKEPFWCFTVTEITKIIKWQMARLAKIKSACQLWSLHTSIPTSNLLTYNLHLHSIMSIL